MSARRLLSSVLLSPFLVSLAAAPAAAQHHFNHRPGLSGAGAGGDGAIDSIDPFNGHLALAIPLGNAYPVSGSLSYGLTLVYNGNVWDSQERSDGFNLYTQSIPSRRSNAGLGWLVSLGRLSPPSGDPGNTSGRWMYIGPDGSEHLFYPTLHPGETAVANVFYSRDGSYLRLKLLPGDLYEVEHPGGAIHKFAKAGAEYRLTQIRDRFTSSLAVSYPDAYTWQLSDNHGRTHYVRFEDDATFGKRVKEVDLAAFNAARAKYLFGYAAGVWVERGCPDDDPTTAPNVQVTLLTSVGILVDGSTYSYSMPASDYTAGDGNGCDRTSGHIQRITLPTGGKIGWTWRSYVFPTTENLFFQQSAGIASRTVYDAAGGALGTWTYETSLVIDPDFKKRELKNAVTDPLGHKTVRYFSVDLEGNFSTEGWSRYDYGLPFTRKQAQGTSPIRYLSSETFDSAGTKLRSTYVRYERDKVEGLPQNEWDFNRRLVSSRTVFDTDGGRYADVTYSDFDGLGHYRTAVLGGNFGAGDSRTETTAFNPARGTYKIDPASNQPAAGHTYTAWPDTAAWVLGTFDSQTAIEGTSTGKSEACFEAATGFLLRARVLKGTGQGNRDVIARFTKDAAGNLTAEESFGGENQSLAPGALCSLSLPAAEYRTDHTYQYGVLRTSQISGMPFKSADRDIDLSTGFVKTSRDSSGLATTFEYDLIGRPTWVKPAQSGWTQTTYTPPSGTATPAKVFIYRRPNGGGTPLASEEVHLDPFGRTAIERVKLPDGTWSDRKTYYNANGWVLSRTEWGTALSTSFSGYDPYGRPTTVTPPDGAAHKVTFTYTGDRIVSRTVKIGTSRNATTGAINEVNAITSETYDRQGRLYQVSEPANPDGTNATATYVYDVGGRLIRVTQTGKKGETSPQSFTQTRVFTYDNRGFLLSQQHPEKGGISGNGVVTYSKHDSRGNPGQVTDGPNDLRFTYDKAGRLTLLEESLGFGAYRPLKQLTYGSANGTGDYRLGKLQTGTRYNYPTIGTTGYSVPVTETYTYGGKQGGVSKRDTSVTVAANGGPPGTPTTFTQSWTWNDLGQLASMTYPRCTHAACTAGTSRTVTPTYTNGFLTGVPGYASAITYHPNGQVNQVTHMNNPANSATWVTDSYLKDPQNIARPQKIDATLGSTVVWNSGAYAYDGAGNLVKAGNSYYLYDKVSRVADGLQYIGPGAGGSTVVFDHEYDGFGNLHSMVTGATPTTRFTPTAPATNRLSGSVTYDTAGNLTGWNGAVYEYDRLNMMWHMKSGTEDWIYLYTADDERIWSFSVGGQPSRWTVRDLDGKVLREYKDTGAAWSIERDYVYRGGLLLAAHTSDASPKDLVQYHLDHLGTPRATTNRNGGRIAYSVYYPFGEEITSVITERMKFTGHERDLNGTTSKDDDLDYMHARFYNPLVGRFTSFDPVGGQSGAPQSWNRSAYVLGNPVNLVDPKGLFAGILGRRMPTFGEEITVTDYNFAGLANFFHFSFFLQNIHFLLTPAITFGAQPPPPPPPPWVNPTNNCQRGCDALGCGGFGARRVRSGNPGPHEGTDYLATAGQDVAAPASGTISRDLQVYSGDSRYTGFAMTTNSGFAVRVFYVGLDTSLIGQSVTAGATVGSAQDLTLKYPTISNHVHVEIRDSAGNLVDPATLIPEPSHCP